MDIPEAKFVSNLETEKERLIHTAKQVYSGFYVKKHFLILPFLDTGNVASVYFPNHTVINKQKLLNLLKGIKLNFPLLFPKKIFEFINFEDLNIDSIDIPDTSYLSKKWKMIESKFWNFIKLVFPEDCKNIKEIEVRLTNYGTVSSYQFIEKSTKKIIIYLRKDANIGNLAESICLSIANSNQQKSYEKKWEENQYLVSTLLSRSSISKLFSKYKPVYDYLTLKINSKIKTASNEYINKLGISRDVKIHLVGRKIYINTKVINYKFTQNELKIMFYLLKNDRYFASIDTLSTLLWENENDFSLWALNKTMQRLRQKLILLGASESVIKNIKGQGYLLDKRD